MESTDLNIQFYETIARLYDAENAAFTEDLTLYSELADDAGEPILDIGCGTGRVTLALARENFRVVGIDLSEHMLKRARKALEAQPQLKPRVTFMQGDALTTEFDEQFKLIIVPFNTFMHFKTQADQLAALRSFAAALDPDGWIILDIPNAGEAYAAVDDDAIVLERMFTEPETGRLVMQQSVNSVNRIDQQLNITWIYDEIGEGGTVHRTLAPLNLRYVFPGEMDLLLAAAGLRRVAFYGDYDQSEFVEGCPRMITLAEKAPERG